LQIASIAALNGLILVKTLPRRASRLENGLVVTARGSTRFGDADSDSGFDFIFDLGLVIMKICSPRCRVALRCLLVAVCYLVIWPLIDQNFQTDGEVFRYTSKTAWFHASTALLVFIILVAIIGASRDRLLIGVITGIVVGFIISQPMEAFRRIGVSLFLSSALIVLSLVFIYTKKIRRPTKNKNVNNSGNTGRS